VSSGADIASEGNGASYPFDIGLVMVADNPVRGYTGATQCTTEEGFRIGAVPFVPQRNINDLSMLVYRPREDYVRQPAVASEGRRRVGGEVTVAETTTLPLPPLFVIAISLRD
jgi:hypothetical protein